MSVFRIPTISTKDQSMFRSTLSGAARRALGVGAAAMVAAGVAAAPAAATLPTTPEFGIHNLQSSLSTTQAGAHPNFRTSFDVNVLDTNPAMPVGSSIKMVRVALPPGLVGDPTQIPQCDLADFSKLNAPCPINTQVGFVTIKYDVTGSGVVSTRNQAVYNLKPAANEPASFGFNVSSAPNVQMLAQVRGSDHGLNTDILGINQAARLIGQDMTLWGVPADPAYDGDRGVCLFNSNLCPATTPRVPFLRNPTQCETDLALKVSVASWANPDELLESRVDWPALTGCDVVPFAPTITATPTAESADAPSGLDVEIELPQSLDPDGIATADLRDAVVTLPKGWSISPSAAHGLQACDDARVGIGQDGPANCPAETRIGTAKIDSPILQTQLTGPVILGPSTTPGNYRIYVVVEGQGARIKLRGDIEADAKTGQLKTSFVDSPQQPFSKFTLSFDGGPRAVLASPETCGTATGEAAMRPWSTASSVLLDVDMTLGGGECGLRPFAPAFSAGVTDATAGASSPFRLQIARADRTQNLAAVESVSLPKGLVADVGSVPVCANAAADAGTCPETSRVGRVEVSAGPGTQPFSLPGRAYLTEGYKGAPYGLSLVVPALAGPYDLGTVVVRSAIHVSTDAQVTVKTDPLPTILAGIPLRIRDVAVVLDRAGFMLNPTHCAAQEISAGLKSTDGASATVGNRFQVGGCAALGYKPTLKTELTGKASELKAKGHPGLTAQLAPRQGDANQRKVSVTLPLSLALDPGNAKALCEPSAVATNSCPESSIVGRASARSILHDELTAPVYFVRGERTDPKTGRIIKTLPSLFVPLKANGVTVNVMGTSTVVKNRLQTTFDNLPDVPLKTFSLEIAGGDSGILTVTNGDYCANTRTQTVDAAFTGQHQGDHAQRMVLGSPCALALVGRGHDDRKVKLRVSGVGSGKVTVSGKGITRTSRTLKSSTVATLRAPMTAATRRALRQGRNVTVKVTTTFKAPGAAKAKKTTKTVVIHARKR